MDLWKLWPTIQTEERISMSYEQEASSKLTEAQKEMVARLREMDKKQKDFDVPILAYHSNHKINMASQNAASMSQEQTQMLEYGDICFFIDLK
jgi:hypothetical protein